MAICLNAIWKSGECGISQELGPARDVDLGLRNALRELNSDRRHGGRYARKIKKEDRNRARRPGENPAWAGAERRPRNRPHHAAKL